MLKRGLEPLRPCGHWRLKPVCLPISPPELLKILHFRIFAPEGELIFAENEAKIFLRNPLRIGRFRLFAFVDCVGQGDDFFVVHKFLSVFAPVDSPRARLEHRAVRAGAVGVHLPCQLGQVVGPEFPVVLRIFRPERR